MESDPSQRPHHGPTYNHIHHAEHSIDPNTGRLPDVASIIIGSVSAMYGILRYITQRVIK